MRILILTLLLAGCSISRPVTHINNPAVADMCQQDGLHWYTHEGVTKRFMIHYVKPSSMSEHCEQPHWAYHSPRACIRGEDIYISTGIKCPATMAHELTHGFGMHHHDHIARRR